MRNDEISVRDIIFNIRTWFKYIISKWKIILVIAMVGGGLGYLYAFFAKPLYTATTTFVLESNENASSLGAYSNIASMIGVNLEGGNGGIFQGDNLFAFYKSRRMLEKVLLTPLPSDGNTLLIDRYLALTKTKDNWSKTRPDLFNIDFRKTYNGEVQRKKDSIISNVIADINKKYLTVDKIDKKLSIMKVEVVSVDEVFSKEFNEVLVTQVNDFYVRTKTKKSLDNVSILQRKTDSVRSVMNGAIQTAAYAIDATPNLNPTRQVQRIVPTQKSQFSVETNKAILAQLVQNLELAKLSLVKEAPLIEIIDKPIYPLAKTSLGKVKAIIVGSVLLSFLTVIYLTLRRTLHSVLREPADHKDEG